VKVIRTLTIVLATLLAVALGSAGVTYALWSSQASASSSVQAGTVGVAITGGESLTLTYNSTALVKSGSLAIANTGSVAAAYSTAVTLAPGYSAGLASAVQVAVWPSPGTCAATAPSSAVTGTWASVPAISGTLAAGTSATWCVRTSVTAPQVTANPNALVASTFTTTATLGSWVATASTSASQNVSPPAAPPIPTLTCANTDAYNALVSWSNVPGADHTTKYEVWVNGSPLSTNHNSGYTSLNLGYGTLVPTYAATNTSPEVKVYQRLSNGSLVLIAQGTVAVRTIVYQYYSANVLQCS